MYSGLLFVNARNRSLSSNARDAAVYLYSCCRGASRSWRSRYCSESVKDIYGGGEGTVDLGFDGDPLQFASEEMQPN